MTRFPEDLVAEAESIGLVLREVARRGEPGRVNRELIEALASAGLLKRLYPEGRDVPAGELCAIRQGLARTCTEAETAFAMQGLGSYPIHQSGSAELRDRWIPAVASGRAVPAFALTEPEAGSDAAALSLLAERDGGVLRLTGEKVYISNAPDADVYTVFARSGEGTGSRGVTALVVPGDAPGLTGEHVEMLAPHPVGRLVFDGVSVPESHVLGDLDHGFRVAMRTLDLFRPSVGAFAVGMAESAMRIATDHAAERTAFGRPISEFQAVSHKLADMVARVELARGAVYRAAAAYDDGRRDALTGLAAVAKLSATETAQFVVDAAVQILGARGLEADHELAHLYREVRAPRIYEGTSEIQRNIIARELLRGRLRP